MSDEDAPASKMLGSYTAEDARRAVLAAPPLRCLGTATMWADVFEPSVGDLAAFLQSQPDLHVLEVDGGSFVRLLHGGIEEFKQAAARLDAVATAALAVSLCVSAGSAALAPLALLGGFVQRALAGAPAEVASAFVLVGLQALPVELQAAVGGSVLLEPAKAVMPDACRVLLAAADASQRRVLHLLGSKLGQTELTSEVATTLFELVEPPPAVKQAASAPSALLVPSAPAAPLLPPMSNNGDLPAAPEPTNQTLSEETEPTATRAIEASEAAEHGVASGEICARVAAKYGVGLDSSAEAPEVRSSLQNLRAGLMRSIQRLAAELYAGNVHFVLELVQNADDNSYAPGVVPTLRILARPEKIIFENNEIGFSERNVLAICSMGESTKKASDAGYIGNKGIGFKSVFKLTATPEVHSRDYHLSFNSEDGGGLGYVCQSAARTPDWCTKARVESSRAAPDLLLTRSGLCARADRAQARRRAARLGRLARHGHRAAARRRGCRGHPARVPRASARDQADATALPAPPSPAGGVRRALGRRPHHGAACRGGRCGGDRADGDRGRRSGPAHHVHAAMARHQTQP